MILLFSKIRNRSGYDLKLHQILTVLFCSVSDTVEHQILIKTEKEKAMNNNHIHMLDLDQLEKQIIIYYQHFRRFVKRLDPFCQL
jgi:hypothetical protein